MKVTVFLESIPGSGFKAMCLNLTGFEVEASTRAEALSRLEELVRARLTRGELTEFNIPVPGEPNPLLALVGSLKDHPDLAEVEENIREYRRQIDADPNWP